MSRPSRLMPAWAPRPVRWPLRLVGYLLAATLVGWYVWLVWRWPIPTSLASAGLVVATVVYNVRERRRVAALAVLRPDESICSFARALPIRELDTWVVRATFEQLQAHLQGFHVGFPVRPSDRLVADLKIDPEDLEDLAVEIATRTGRTMEGCPANPYYDKVTTVEDLINFLCAQPKGAT
jgi:hypothetical protein